jgi:hypothetical protein
MSSWDRIECFVLVYQQTKKPYRHRIAYALASDNGIKPGEKHIATLDPAAWISHLLNSKDKIKSIEKLYI